MGREWGSVDTLSRAGQPQRCDRQARGVRCVWRLADIPTAADPAAATLNRRRAGSGAADGGARTFQAARTPTASGPELTLVASSSPSRAPIGGRVRVTTSVFSARDSVEPVQVQIGGDGALAMLDADASNGTCAITGATVACAVVARPGAPATISVIVEVLPGSAGMQYVTITADGVRGGQRTGARTAIELEPYAITPGLWPPPTLPTTATPTPAPTDAPVWPTMDPHATPLPTALPTAAPPGQGPGAPPLTCAPQTLVQLPGVADANGTTDTTRLIAPAAAAFLEARAEIVAQTGRDPLARLADALRAPEFRSTKPGVSRMSWHMTGRAVDLNTGYPWRRVPEGHYWRLFLGATDVTAIFARHGFTRIPDREDSAEWWHYEYRPDGIAWPSAMLRVWPLGRLQRAFPEIAWATVGCQGAGIGIIEPPDESLVRCDAGAPAYSSPVEELPGCGPPVRAGDTVHMLDSVLGFVGMTGRTTGPHLHLGLQVKSYDGMYHQTDICTPEWLQGQPVPQGGAADDAPTCWTEMADPLAFLPLAPPPGDTSYAVTTAGTTATAIIPEGAPFQLPPPNYPGSLLAEPAPEATPVGQYWSPYQDGGRCGGGRVIEWFRGATCGAWNGFPWCAAGSADHDGHTLSHES